MKDLGEKGREESAVVDHKCVPEGQPAEVPACPSGTHLSFFIYLSTWRPEDKKEPLNSSSWSWW